MKNDAASLDDAVVTDDEIRAYAAGELGWSSLRNRGVDYYQVLSGLGALGLRPPIAPMTGPNVAARRRGIALLREALGLPVETE